MELPRSTLVGIETAAADRAGLWGRRALLILLLVFVLCGASGLLGVHSTTSSAQEDGWAVSMRYAATARAGLDVPWEVTVRHTGGFGKEITLAVTASSFDILESQGFEPEPSDETRDADTMYLTFASPPGDTLVVSFDAYIKPSAQEGRSGTVAVLTGGRRVAAVPVHTVLFP
ncbi:hypothetical protein [Nostocoides japonicum]|uniref:hypothetical protein n=1 Tax=Nostocoides japonicum TaxID=99481 RepID=UPI000AD8DC66|nr:hypothetical protein [Tetrasphaera japonica]